MGNEMLLSVPGCNRSRRGREAMAAAADPGGELGEGAHELTSPGVVVQCIVKSYNAGLQTYIVNGPGCHDKLAVDAASSLNVLGTRQYAAHAPFTPILVWLEHGQGCEHALILGAIAHPENELVDHRGGLLSEGAGVGLAYDPMHRSPVRVDEDEDEDFPVPLFEANCGRPWDTLAGDHGLINELGVGLAVLKMSSYLHGGYASVGVSYIDDMAYIRGDRISMESPSMEYDHFQDQGESSSVYRSTPYLWEGMGAQSPNVDPANAEDRYLGPEYAGEEQLSMVDVQNWDQIGIFRWMSLEGYLGGLLHEYGIVPINAAAPVRRSDERFWPGVFERQVDVDGFYTVRTAKGMLFEKTVMIPVPEQKREPWDPQGDKDAACDYGSDPYDTDKVDYDWGDTDPTSRAGRTVDHNAFRTGEAGVRGLHGHNTNGDGKDWHLPQDTQAAIASGTNPITPLGCQFHADLPMPASIAVDHRRPDVKYYPGRAFVHWGDDGSITFQDAYGSSIVMSGGNIELCPRGDLIMRPGRSVVAMAPRDVVLNAGHNAEVTASEGDVRVKAEKNLHMLGGNAVTAGGVLIENRANDPYGGLNDFSEQGEATISSGIVFKSGTAPVILWGSEIFAQSQVGRVVIDAGRGDQDVDILGDDVRVTGKSSSAIIAGVKPGAAGGQPADADMIKVKSNSAVIAAGSVLAEFAGGNLKVLRDGTGKANVLFDGSLSVTTTISSPNTEIAELRTQDIYPSLAEVEAGIKSNSSVFVTDWTALEAAVYTADSGYGNSEFFDNFSFSFNNSTLYWTTSSFVLNSTFWQVNFAKGQADVWNQPVVLFKGSAATRPWPGNETWVGGGFGKIESGSFNNYDVATEAGKTTPRTETSGTAPEEVPLDDNYVVGSQ